MARRPAANLPGKIALAIDPSLLDELRGKCAQGSVITVGTNGKTSTNNLLADAFEAAGCTIICNRTGANLAAGITSALMQQPLPRWGVFECDELWLAHVLPRLRSNYVLLLNLFRDQLDRCGEIDRIQTSIAGGVGRLAGHRARVQCRRPAVRPHCRRGAQPHGRLWAWTSPWAWPRTP